MGHLNIEELARLVSEKPSRQEREHLDGCPACRAELADLVAQTESLGSLPDLRPPAGDWEALEARLTSEGLILSSGLIARSRRPWLPHWLQAAAAIVLFLGGAVVGPRLMGEQSIAERILGSGGSLAQPVSLVADPGLPAPSASNLAEAAEIVRLTERQYSDALLQYRQFLDAQGRSDYVGDPTDRFAAVEAIVAAGRAAVQQAPADPYVNGVLVSALAEREALLRTASLGVGSGVF